MIGIDYCQDATVIRQFSCQKCYRSWWRRVRTKKQVSRCKKCKVKYDAIEPENEFGVGQFRCQRCNNEFK